MSDTIQAYCMKCREKRDMLGATAVFASNGTPGTRGTCTVCGTKLFRMGATAAHEGLPKPEVVKKTKKKK
jgi:DNA topoisomerase I